MRFHHALGVLTIAAFWFDAPNFEHWHMWPVGGFLALVFLCYVAVEFTDD